MMTFHTQKKNIFDLVTLAFEPDLDISILPAYLNSRLYVCPFSCESETSVENSWNFAHSLRVRNSEN